MRCSSCDRWQKTKLMMPVCHAPFKTMSSMPLRSVQWFHCDRSHVVSVPACGPRTWMLPTHRRHLNLRTKRAKKYNNNNSYNAWYEWITMHSLTGIALGGSRVRESDHHPYRLMSGFHHCVAVLPFRSYRCRCGWELKCWKRLSVYIGMKWPERWLVVRLRQKGKK